MSGVVPVVRRGYEVRVRACIVGYLAEMQPARDSRDGWIGTEFVDPPTKWRPTVAWAAAAMLRKARRWERRDERRARWKVVP